MIESERGGLPAPPLTEARRVLIAFIVASAFLMQSVDGTLLTNAIPTIARDLNASPLTLHLAITGYLVTLAVFMPISGWFADRFGARRIFCLSLGIFTLGSILCGLSNSLTMLVLSRIVQGFGGAMMTPVGRLIVLRAFGPGRVLDAIYYVSTPVLLGPLIGPVLGALIIAVAPWQWIFYVNVPLCGIAIAAALAFIDRDGPAREVPAFDTRGFLVAGTGLVLFQLGIELLAHPVLGPAATTGVFVASTMTLALYVRHARRVPAPALDISLYRIRSYAVGVVAGGLGRVGLNAMTFLLPLLLQLGFGLTPLAAASYSSLSAFGAMGSKSLIRRSLDRFGYRRFLIAVVLAGSAMLVGFACLRPSFPLLLLAPYVIVLGAIRNMHFNTVNTLTYAEVPQHRLSTGVASAGVIQQLSMGLGVSLSSAVLAFRIGPNGHATLADFGAAFIAMAIIPLLSLPILLCLQPTHGRLHQAVIADGKVA